MPKARLLSGACVVVSALGVVVIGGSASAAPQVQPATTRALTPAEAKLVNLTSATQAFHRGENLRFTALRAVAGTCTEVRISVDGKTRIDRNPTFPYTFDVSPHDPLYPTKSGRYEIAIEGLSPNCTGRLTHTFAFNASGQGEVTDVQVTGFKAPDLPGQITALGHGMCRLRIATYTAPYDHAKSSPVDMQFFDAPVVLPFTMTSKRISVSGGDHVAEVLALGVKVGGQPDDTSKKTYPSFEGCVVSAAGNQGNFVVRKTFSTFPYGTPPANKPSAQNSSSGSSSSGGGGGAGAGGGGFNLGSSKPATGKITSLQVPGGSFAEDDPQKLQVSGSGGCGFDLAIKRVDAGGNFNKTWPVNPMSLDAGATLYNGSHFDTLAEGSYSANVVGKNGCTGTATIDFKVTPKNSTKTVKGQPTISFEKGPIAGSAFKRSKDSQINFVVKVPQSVKDEPYASCCDVEWDFRNAYGGWEALPGSPFNDAGWGLAVSQTSGTVPKSVSGFTQGTFWRVKVRAYKYKTEFEWSDWLEFQVDQN